MSSATPQTLTSLKDLGGPSATAADASSLGSDLPEPKIDAQGRAYATGKRKNAVARVWIVGLYQFAKHRHTR